MGRPKGSRNKPKSTTLPISPIRLVKYQKPKDVDKYELKRLYWYLLAIEKKIQLEPTSVNPRMYQEALRAYTNAVREYEDAKKTVDKKESPRSAPQPSGQSGAGKDGSPDMGARIPAVNPIT